VRILLEGGSSNNFIQMEKIPKRKSQSSRWVNNEWDQLTFFLLLHVPTRLQVIILLFLLSFNFCFYINMSMLLSFNE
jgi:hypothetical protein